MIKAAAKNYHGVAVLVNRFVTGRYYELEEKEAFEEELSWQQKRLLIQPSMMQ